MIDSLILNNRSVSFEKIKEGSAEATSEFEETTISFCRQWLNEASSFRLKTSGSTGEPKIIEVTRTQMLESASQTIDFFKLSYKDTVLVCLNTAYIAGIMMLVRGLEAGSKIIIVEPLGNPLIDINESIDFLAIVPLQLNNILEEPSCLLKLESIRATIVGGAPVSHTLQKKLDPVRANVWATFGMTETLTHFALRKLSPSEEESFQVLKSTKIKTDNRGCLVVTSPVTKNAEIFTNDLVDINTKDQFIWLGRIDNVINSGGVKLQIELLETKTAVLFSELKLQNNFFIGPVTDSKLNEAVCLVVESDVEVEELEKADFNKYFGKYEVPKRISYLPRFVYTPTGKINRQASLQIINFLA